MRRLAGDFLRQGQLAALGLGDDTLTGEQSNVGSLDDYLTMAFDANTTITVDSNTPANSGGTGQTVCWKA